MSSAHVQIKYGIGGKTEGAAVIGNRRFARMVSTTHQPPPSRTPTVASRCRVSSIIVECLSGFEITYAFSLSGMLRHGILKHGNTLMT
jgi:hypothetical protein